MLGGRRLRLGLQEAEDRGGQGEAKRDGAVAARVGDADDRRREEDVGDVEAVEDPLLLPRRDVELAALQEALERRRAAQLDRPDDGDLPRVPDVQRDVDVRAGLEPQPDLDDRVVDDALARSAASCG